jgi:hypothetical protein
VTSYYAVSSPYALLLNRFDRNRLVTALHFFIFHPIVSIIMNSNVVGVDWMFTASGGERSVEESGIVGID